MHEASGWPSIWLPLRETWTQYSSSSSCICIKKVFTFQALIVKLTVWERLWTTCLLMSERFVEHLSKYYMQGWLQASYMTIKFPQTVQISLLSEQFFTSFLLFYFSEVLTQNLRVWKLISIEYRLHLIFKVCWLFFADSRREGEPTRGWPAIFFWLWHTSTVVWEKGESFKWDPETESPILRNINVEIKNGTLVVIVGTVVTRKSAFLECILGEMEKISGKVCCLSNPLWSESSHLSLFTVWISSAFLTFKSERVLVFLSAVSSKEFLLWSKDFCILARYKFMGKWHMWLNQPGFRMQQSKTTYYLGSRWTKLCTMTLCVCVLTKWLDPVASWWPNRDWWVRNQS